MKQAPASLAAYLRQNEQLLLPNLYSFTLSDGTVLRYADAQYDITIPQPGGGLLIWKSRDVLVQGVKYKSAVGLDVDEQTVKLSYWPASSPQASLVTLASGAEVPIAVALQEGLFDGGTLRWDRIVLEEWGGVPVGHGEANPNGTISDGRVIMNQGRVSTLDSVGRVEAQMKVKSDLVLLDIDMPRNLWQPGCVHTLYDVNCTLSRGAFVATGSVGAGASNIFIPWSGASADYNQGTVIFGSGPNAGIKATVKLAQAGGFWLGYPLDNVPDTGDAFTIYQGCDKSFARCTQFNNTIHFRGYPNVPPPETAA